jgi:hypothetical protein
MLPLALTAVAWSAPPPDLNGVWHLQTSLSEVHSHIPPQLTWQIEQSDNSIHLIERSEEKKSTADIRCATDGHDCKVKDEGHTVQVSFYYNGPALIELESEGQNRDTVTKKRMHLSSDGATLTVEVIHVFPTGRAPEKLVLTRQTSPGPAK